MIRLRILQLLLLPVSLLYGGIMSLRNLLYDIKLIKSTTFNIPVIGVGNLAIGGTGKTPHVEYLIQKLSPHLKIGVMSRGYRRKTRGFRLATPKDTSETLGDEPYMFMRKYPHVSTSVCESRALGIPMLLNQVPDIQTIILDDSFQHRSVLPGINILLTAYHRLYTSDFLLPSGRLREWPGAAGRADIIIVTKCPHNMSLEDQKNIIKKVRPQDHQQIYFTSYQYGMAYDFFTATRVSPAQFDQIILLSAIADESHIARYLEGFKAEVHTVSYEDHHYYNAHQISTLKLQYDNLSGHRKAIFTTEKDATRLFLHAQFIKQSDLPIYILPVTVKVLFGEDEKFLNEIRSFLLNFEV